MTDALILQEVKKRKFQSKSIAPVQLPLIEKQRNHIRKIDQILSARGDLNMNLPHHEAVLAKAKRLGNGTVAPLTKTLRD